MDLKSALDTRQEEEENGTRLLAWVVRRWAEESGVSLHQVVELFAEWSLKLHAQGFSLPVYCSEPFPIVDLFPEMVHSGKWEREDVNPFMRILNQVASQRHNDDWLPVPGWYRGRPLSSVEMARHNDAAPPNPTLPDQISWDQVTTYLTSHRLRV
ncbi:MAG: hypothetical protein HQL50_03900 [Magnetococcales bacterium]|nr:hypothetical protein [Magnetococcales bacterium]